MLTKATHRDVQKERIHRISRVHQRIGGEKDRVGIIVSNDLIGEYGEAQTIGQCSDDVGQTHQQQHDGDPSVPMGAVLQLLIGRCLSDEEFFHGGKRTDNHHCER